MNRIIKFRYYDSVIKQFVYSNEFKYPGICERLEMFFAKARNYSEDVIQQFTGLKDKNGRDIYEGDIIQEFPDCRDKSKVIMTNNGMWWAESLDSESGMGQELYMYPKCSVIGNIFENPELCKSGVDKLPPNR